MQYPPVTRSSFGVTLLLAAAVWMPSRAAAEGAAPDTHSAKAGGAGDSLATAAGTRQRSAASVDEADANEAAEKAARRERRHQRRAEAEAAKAAEQSGATAAASPEARIKPERAKATSDGAGSDVRAKPERAKVERAKTEQPKRRAGAGKRERQPTAEYRRLRDGWHERVVETGVVAEPIVDPKDYPPLVISPVNGGTLVSVTPQREDGGFSSEELEYIARAFAPKDMKHTHKIAPHLVDLVYRTMRHFKAPLVHLVSGYRADRAGSRHTQGRAIDMVIPGVSNEELAEYVRTFGFCGVGIYPKSGFVHLDVRESSYFWVDNSLPDERSRSTPIMPRESAEADRQARARGEAPDAFVPDNERDDRAATKSYVKRAQRRRAAAARAAARAAAASDDTPGRRMELASGSASD